jgi:pterin-4a-carbinolamine dehydratase/uncharacterized protein (DUF2267 family)
MGSKQMEGDSERRRARAQRAREQGSTPSEQGTTLGASKQPEHKAQGRRTGPPPAGTRKPLTHDPEERRPPGRAPQWPRSTPVGSGNGAAGVRYRGLIAEAAGRSGVPFDRGRRAGEATITVLARALPPGDRERLLAAVPTELHDGAPTATASQPVDLADFLGQVATLAEETPEQARHQAQAVLSVLREQDPDLVDSLTVPPYLEDLMPPPPVGGGIVGPAGGVPPLSDDELREVLGGLPRWSGDRRALVRTIALPPDNLERVLERLAGLRDELGRGPKIARDGDGSATLTVRTASVGTVTAADVDLARRVDAAIDEAGAGMNAG